MKIIRKNINKAEYRLKEDVIFCKKNFNNKNFEPDDAIMKKFNFHEKIHDFFSISPIEFLSLLREKFQKISPQFCIATILEDDPIVVFDLNTNTDGDYFGIMSYPKHINYDFPEINIGLGTIYETLLFYSTDLTWCVYANRYYDIILIKWD